MTGAANGIGHAAAQAFAREGASHGSALAMIGVEGGIFGEVATTAEVVERLT